MFVRCVLVVICVGVVHSANPNYSYHVKIDDAAHANFQEKAETRKGADAVGFYSVVLPNGSRQVVNYSADDRGYNPTVTYSHAGSSVFHEYAPAFVQDKRVQIVDKFKGPPPALNIQPFALPQPSYGLAHEGHTPLIVPAPLRAAPAPHLIAQAQGVEYAPAYMPPVTAFVQQQVRTYLPPTPVVEQVRTYLPPQPQVQVQTYLPPPPPQQIQFQQQTYLPPPPPQIVQQEVRTYLPPPPPQIVQQEVRTYLPPPPPQQIQFQQQTYLPPPAPIRYEVPAYGPPAVIAVQKPSLLVSTPKKHLQVFSVERAPVTLVQDSYAVAPKHTVTDHSGPVYPESIKVVNTKPFATYGPPNFTPGKPLSTYEVVQPAIIKKPVTKVHVTVVEPPPQAIKVVQAAPKLVQYAQPQIQYVQQPLIQKVVQQQQVYAPVYAPAVAVQKVVTPAIAPLGLYAGAVGYHTQNSHQNAYQHSYGTQGFQVTSSRQFNKALLPVAQPQYVQQHVQQQAAPIVHYQPQPLLQQQVLHHQTYAPQYLPPAPAVLHQVSAPVAYGPPPPPQQIAVAAPAVYGAPIYGAPAAAVAKLVQPAIAVSGKKIKNPLTFAYSYDQGAAKVSHSYSGSGW